MRCAEVEVLLCDYLDGTLGAGERQAVEHHLATCAACAELADDAAAALRFMERVADVEPPGELMTRLMFEAPWRKAEHRPPGRFGQWLNGVLRPVLQPRLAMGMALTILSFSMLGRYVMPGRQIEPADMNPAKIWTALDNRVHRLWDRTVKSYESIRFVYQIQSRLREWQEQQGMEPPESGIEGRRLPASVRDDKQKNKASDPAERR